MRFLSDPSIPPNEKLILNGRFAVPYFCMRSRFPITDEYIGSAIEVPLIPSTFSGTPMLAGSLR